MSESIAAFGDSRPNTLSVKMHIERVETREVPQHLGQDPNSFSRYVDKLTCGTILNRYAAQWPAKGLTITAIHGRVQTQPLARARHLITIILRNYGWSFPQIGYHLGRDHTTVMSGYDRGMALLERPGIFSDVYREIEFHMETAGFKPRLFK